MAQKLFHIDGVARVFYGKDYISVTKEDGEGLEWPVMKPEIMEVITDHYAKD